MWSWVSWIKESGPKIVVQNRSIDQTGQSWISMTQQDLDRRLAPPSVLTTIGIGNALNVIRRNIFLGTVAQHGLGELRVEMSSDKSVAAGDRDHREPTASNIYKKLLKNASWRNLPDRLRLLYYTLQTPETARKSNRTLGPPDYWVPLGIPSHAVIW